jgi:hypothetical protein
MTRDPKGLLLIGEIMRMMRWRSKAVNARLARQRSSRQRVLADIERFCDDQEQRLRDELFGPSEQGTLAESRRTFVIESRGLNVRGNQGLRRGNAQ